MLTRDVTVIDPYGVLADDSLPGLRAALDPVDAEARIGAMLASDGEDVPELRQIRVTRYKPGRRCLIAYRFQTGHQQTAVLGKVRARGTDRRTFEVQEALQQAGVAVPPPVGVVDEYGMWVQRVVPGVDLMSRLIGDADVSRAIMGQVAGLIHSLHGSAVPARKTRTIGDELAILHRRLGALARERPALSGRIARVLLAAERLAGRLTARPACGIHSDFYPDQVIVNGSRQWLVDLDLYSQGDPGLDVGNFSAHLVELGLRLHGDPQHFSAQQQAFEQCYVAQAGEQIRDSIDVYTTLTLARHIQLSTLFPDRRHITGHLLQLTEERLGRVY